MKKFYRIVLLLIIVSFFYPPIVPNEFNLILEKENNFF